MFWLNSRLCHKGEIKDLIRRLFVHQVQIIQLLYAVVLCLNRHTIVVRWLVDGIRGLLDRQQVLLPDVPLLVCF